MTVTIDDIRRAAANIDGQVVRTACTRSRVLSKLTGAEVWLKFENFQFTASFKERGALNKLLQLGEAERAAGVCAMSAGNHAQGVAYHATRLGIRSVIVMPRSTPFTKVRNTRELGGEVILRGDTLADAQEYLEAELVGKQGMTLVHPYDDPHVIAGQGTVGLEMLEQAPQLDTLAIPIGGGGLISGIAIAAHAIKAELRVVGVESAGYASAYAALQDDDVPIKGGQTIAEGIAVKNIGRLTLQIIREHVAELMRVEEAAIERAIGLLAGETPDAWLLGRQAAGALLIVLLLAWAFTREQLHLPLERWLGEDREMEVFAALLVAFGLALLTALLGLSTALGAFNTAGSLGFILGPLTGGLVSEVVRASHGPAAGYQAAFAVAGVSELLCAALALPFLLKLRAAGQTS